MKRALSYWWFKLLLAGLAVFLFIQVVPYNVDNPTPRDEPAWDSPETRALAVRSCYSCHSNETKTLWFEKAAPVKWYIANHVKEGRAALNFSEWNTSAGYHADEAAEPVGKSMPPSYYTYFGLHHDSKLTPAETKALIAGLEKTIKNDPPTSGSAGRGRGGDGD